jgi:hypothetical protein
VRFNWPMLCFLALACVEPDVVQPPVVTLVTPTEGQLVVAGSTMMLEGTVEGGVGDLAYRFEVNGVDACAGRVDVRSDVSCQVEAPETDFVVALVGIEQTGVSASESANVVVVANAVPTISIERPGANDSYRTDVGIVTGAVVSDDDHGFADLVVSWSSDVEGPLVDAGTEPDDEGYVVGMVFLSEGPHLLTATVVDVLQARASTTVEIDVGPANEAPTCEITSTPVAVLEGDSTELVGWLDDAEQEVSSLEVSWQSDVDGDLGAGELDSLTGGVSLSVPLSLGAHEVTLTVKDALHAICTSAVMVDVVAKPVATIDAPADGARELGGVAVSISAHVDDKDTPAGQHDALLLSDLDGLLYSGKTDNNGEVHVEQLMSPGEHQITFTVGDGNYTDVAELAFYVNALPTAPKVHVDPKKPDTLDDLTAELDTPATDADGDKLSYQYSWTITGATGPTTADISSSKTTKGEVWQVTVFAYDGLEAGGSVQSTVTIKNTAPTMEELEIDVSSPIRGDEVTCWATGLDADGDAISNSYEWSVGTTVLANEASLTLDDEVAPNDTLTCTATLDDGDGGVTIASVDVTVGNQSPTFSEVSVAPELAQVGTELTCNGTATDPEESGISYTWRWRNGGQVVSKKATYTLTASDAPGDTVTCTLTATDEDGGEAEASADAMVLNTAPTIVDVQISPVTAKVGDELTCGSSPDDQNGGSLSTSYQWSKGLATLGTGSTYLVVATDDPDETIVCTATTEDDDGASASGSDSVVVENSTPVLVSSSVDQAEARVGDILTCEIVAEDPDGDVPAYSYLWTNFFTQVGSGPTYTVSVTDDPGESVMCTALATDPMGAYDGDAIAVPVVDSVPTAPAVVLAPSDAEAGIDELICTVTADGEDPDGGSVSHEVTWFVDGEAYPDDVSAPTPGTTTLTGDTVSFLDLTDQLWRCEVVAVDDVGAGTTGADELTPPMGTCEGEDCISGSWTTSDPAPTHVDD